MRHTLCNQVIFIPAYWDQLLLVIKGEDDINNNQVIKAISWAYNTIIKIVSIFITNPTKIVANNISGNNLNIVLGIDNQKIKIIVKGQQKIGKIWDNIIIMVVDKWV